MNEVSPRTKLLCKLGMGTGIALFAVLIGWLFSYLPLRTCTDCSGWGLEGVPTTVPRDDLEHMRYHWRDMGKTDCAPCDGFGKVPLLPFLDN